MWNPIETIPYETGVIVTDTADGVYIGQIHEAEATGVFTGTAMEDGAPVELLAGELTGWRPAHQSGEEMMAELGYTKKVPAPGGTCWVHKSGLLNIEVSFNMCRATYYDPAFGKKKVGIAFEEILALAELIKEEQKW